MSITKQADMCPTKRRKLARSERATKRRKDERLARRAEQTLKLEKSTIALALERDAKKTYTVTYEDLDVDQLITYKGIHDWWNLQIKIGGVAKPLTIGGFAGTGKSTLLAIALPTLKSPKFGGVRIKYCAFTGKAANVLVQKSLDADTIHSLIYHNRGTCGVTNKPQFELKEEDEVKEWVDVIVVDEASMVPDTMRKDLESFGIPIIYTGDHGQLPPIGGQGNVMADPEFKLETPHRQALESGIIEIATLVRTGKRVHKGVYGKYSDAKVVGKKYLEDVKLLASADMVICYTNAKRAELNESLRRYRGFGGTFPMVGEKLICVKNNRQTGMFNGLIVYVKCVDFIDGFLIMDVMDEMGNEYHNIKAYPNYFYGDGHPSIKGRIPFDLFEFAYAITGHKSQGSQWDNVIVIEEEMYRQKQDIKKRWMYTVLTRAAKQLTWITKQF